MAVLKSRGMKILKIVHLLGVACWLGGAVSMIMLNLSSVGADREGMLYGINFSSHVLDMWVVITLGLGTCVLTGLIYGLLTPWDFFRLRWVAVKWAVTAFCFASGWLFLGRWEAALLAMSEAAGNGALQEAAYRQVRALHLAGSLVQVALLIFLVAVSVIRPWKRR
ncbi:MAG: hypothetical protein HDR50_06000 [Desulfovibrio sp.]|uniref:hypothetical protein n=1 Tax=Desulfovibrio sp. TaxID=885 RepID=UPI001A6E4E8A|nr:hypothetical protein [Desulfovibrio sp.]MBD5417203.1 hypothetical protein [Desulfovibrio sp.]